MLHHPFKILAALLLGSVASHAASAQPSAPNLEQRLEGAKAAAQKLFDVGQQASPAASQGDGQGTRQQFVDTPWKNS